MPFPFRRSVLTLAVAACVLVGASSALAAPHVREFALPAEFAVPNDITTGPDGALWASDGSLGVVWRITPEGKVRRFEVGGQPAGVTSFQGALAASPRPAR